VAKYVKSVVKINTPRIQEVNQLAVKALEMTAKELHTDVVNAKIMPRDTGDMEEKFTFVDTSQSSQGKVGIVTSTPYARRMYYHPEYHFQKWENAFAQGKWYNPWLKGGIYQNDIKDNFQKFMKRLMK
jgi:hypothetical protein